MRVGIGFDVHGFDPQRPLVLGGVTIPSASGLAGHSDADVICHAVADAVLGAAGLGDIGEHFPPDDERWRDAASIGLLERVVEMTKRAGFTVTSVDTVVLLEKPKLSPFRAEMRTNLARVLRTDAVGVKATTANGLGTVGRGEGAACMAVALLDEA